MIIAGIDPGLTGAVAFVDHHGLRAVFDLPTMPRPNIGPAARVKRQCDGRALAAMLREQHDPREPLLVVLEDVRMMGGQNNAMQAQEALVHTRGVVEGVRGVVMVYATDASGDGAPRDYTLYSTDAGKSWSESDDGTMMGGYFDPDTNTLYSLFAYTLKKRKL
ncbi:RuvC family protein [Paraburkholderia acidipaludis]|uniref:hypothetical protein n=1 Tax=Paraburkholderia acidipaludis TaxID=660537 RepID=UPI000ABB6914|nr:hypothetical protein [Paraburkholderia acidipaludis]